MVSIRASVNPSETEQGDPVMQFVMCMLNSVTTAHILHFKTKSFSQHMALGTFYSEIGELVDKFVEAFQGKYGLLTNYPSTCELQPNAEPLAYMEYLTKETQTLRRQSGFPQDTDLQNEVENISNLINTTRYKLANLK
jgi:hypothetical protein